MSEQYIDSIMHGATIKGFSLLRKDILFYLQWGNKLYYFFDEFWDLKGYSVILIRVSEIDNYCRKYV